MLNYLTVLQKDILAAAATSPDQPTYCNVLLRDWSVKAGERVFDGGPEVEEAFNGLVQHGIFRFDVSHYVLTREGRHLAANLPQSRE